ncbi:MAG TPA: glycosyltransferase [Patescibacteria group bacterium]|nr:glycosyltransferase [Patescibacteria group bacterium]
MEFPFFSIVIPVLNEKKVLPHLLKDLQKQTFGDFDIYIVDGGSTDGTIKIVEKMIANDGRLHLLRSKVKNVGYQRNMGGKKSTGQYIIFFDADTGIPEYFLSGLHYQCIKEKLEAFTNFAIPDSENAKDKLFMHATNIIFDSAAKLKSPLCFGSCIGVQRSVFVSTHGFDESIHFMEDTEFAKRVVRSGFRFSVLKEPVYVYSLRRMRKEGNILMYRNIVPTAKALLLDKKITAPLPGYPMLGGTYFDRVTEKKQHTQSYLRLKNLVDSVRELIREER